ncbi:MAG: YkgJ family cysteine cluster protein [Epsilonproteobacteria bacterium]|nr:zinc/iron-chelating domain-containing protein [Campylobacterota bacterium]NPA56151.1 YkgJ family cysteine cluster protein [Campylobacterota bacterium]
MERLPAIPFPCTRCGLCCRQAGTVKELSELDRGDGICRYLNLEENICTIYGERPEICTIGKSYEKRFSHIWSWGEFLFLNLFHCVELQRKSDKKSEYVLEKSYNYL